ncbi:MAG: phosphodiester glycosidase family protein [Myxococcales bacterium]|nr:MAG: phosphodiester glycosidase family protein [Myxococcales bacterium]
MVFSLSGSAAAKDEWSHPYSGIKHLHRRENGKDYHATFVDLNSAELSVIATRPADRGLTVRDFAKRYDAQIAINANYYDVGIRPCGMAAGAGTVWTDAYEEACSMSFAFGALNQAKAFDSSETLKGPVSEEWMREIVSGKPWLVRQGIVQAGWHDPPHMRSPHPRTALGLSEDRNTLLIVVADGRKPGFPGLYGHQLAKIMADLGAYDAVNLDGGGSSVLYIEAEGGIQNHPSGSLRTVGNHLGIRVNKGAVWYGAALESMSSAPTLQAGDSATMWVRYRNTGRFTWRSTGPNQVELVSSLSRPSPFYLPSWVSSTIPVGLSHEVRPGDSVTFEFEIGAPAADGDFDLQLLPKMAGIEAVEGVAASWQLQVMDEPEQKALAARNAARGASMREKKDASGWTGICRTIC